MYPFFYKVKEIARVVDGDTVDCVIDLGFSLDYNTRVRLQGIDAPESRTRDLEEKHFGNAATQYLQSCIDNATEIFIKTELGNGKYGRVLGTLYLDGVNINERMCAEGHAVPYLGQDRSELEDAHMMNREKLISEGKVENYE